jgi:hypothetical protein
MIWAVELLYGACRRDVSAVEGRLYDGPEGKVKFAAIFSDQSVAPASTDKLSFEEYLEPLDDDSHAEVYPVTLCGSSR